MVFEKVDGGELLTHISDRKYFTEREASQVTHDVASALSFVHGKGTAFSPGIIGAGVYCDVRQLVRDAHPRQWTGAHGRDVGFTLAHIR